MGGKWKVWTKAEDVYLNNNFGTVSISELQKALKLENSEGRKKVLSRLIDLDLIQIKEASGSYTICCKYCHSEFIVNKASRHREYCSRRCQSKAIVKNDSRQVSKCVECGEEFKHYGERILCSIECNARYASHMRLGENNPNFNPDKTKEQECLNCSEIFCYTLGGKHKGRLPKFCTRECWDEFQKGKTKDLSGPAIYSTPYPKSFREIKESIRKRDQGKCLMCSSRGVEGRQIPVHHIDYDKNNNDEENLVCLCERCHGLTNFNRIFWESMFKSIFSGSKIVKKGWGLECHITNNKEYCLKYLIFFKDKQFSYHYHTLKKELWHCLVGKFKAKTDPGSCEEEFTFRAGEKIEIKQNVIHQLTAIENSILVEVSTTSYAEDSYRIIKGD